MLKKLVKYEFKASARILLPIDACLVLISIISRLLLIIPIDNIVYKYFSTLLLGTSVFLMFVSIATTLIICVIRYYLNYYTNEGYLMLTLPVSRNNLIFSKLFVSLLYMLIEYISLAISCFFVLGYSNSKDFILAFISFFTSDEFAVVCNSQFIILLLEMFIGFLVFHIYYLLFGYASISLGQVLLPTHKIIGAFLSAIILYIGSMIINSIIVLSGSIFASTLNINFDNNAINIMLLFIASMIILYILYCIVYYLITRIILKRKINI